MTMQPDNSPDEFLFADESASEHADGALSLGAPRIWTVMVIDDDADVHQATRFALEGAVLFERRIQLMHAHSAAQARDLLMTQPDIALVLLDVVMETADAGLQPQRVGSPDLAHRVANGAARLCPRAGNPAALRHQ